MANDRAVGELERFLADRGDRLMRTAVLLTGSREAGQDLLQAALERLLRHWRTLGGDPEAYLRRTLYNLAADGFRRQGRPQRRQPGLVRAARHGRAWDGGRPRHGTRLRTCRSTGAGRRCPCSCSRYSRRCCRPPSPARPG